MKAAQVIARGQVELVEVPLPTVPAGHALIRPICLSLCASDIFLVDHMPEKDYPLQAGTSGHEMVGIVAAVNGTHPEVGVGSLTLTIAPEQAAMAERYVAPFANVLPVPKNVPPEHLVQAQQLGTVIYACKQLPTVTGKDVVVVGQGSAGLWFNVMLKRMGARTIIGVDLLAHRLAVSKWFGATHTVNNSAENPAGAVRAILDGKLADVVIEAVGETAAINLSIALADEYGHLLQFGVPHETQLMLDYYELFRKCLTLNAVVFASREPRHESTRMALEMIANGDVDVRPILTHRFPLEAVVKAYDLQRSREDGAIKILVDVAAL